MADLRQWTADAHAACQQLSDNLPKDAPLVEELIAPLGTMLTLLLDEPLLSRCRRCKDAAATVVCKCGADASCAACNTVKQCMHCGAPVCFWECGIECSHCTGRACANPETCSERWYTPSDSFALCGGCCADVRVVVVKEQ